MLNYKKWLSNYKKSLFLIIFCLHIIRGLPFLNLLSILILNAENFSLGPEDISPVVNGRETTPEEQ